MQSKIKLHLDAVQPEDVAADKINAHCSTPLRTAVAKKLALKEGYILLQSSSNYFGHIEMFEYAFKQTAFIDFSVIEPSYFMHVDLAQNSCYLCYRPMGKYRKTVPAGKGQIMLITFNPDWFIYKCQKLPELKLFATSFCNPENTSMSLSSVGIAYSLFKAVQKMDVAAGNLNTDDEGYNFINGCINKYFNSIKSRNATSREHHLKGQAIASFINENFTTEMADDAPKLAYRFMVSERNLARLAKNVFGIPLHEQVIKLRMDYARRLLSTSGKPVKEIALLAGYKEPHYFSKAFKKYYGKCPKSVTALQLPVCLLL
ncbi:helix-turn-helix transcriptional regulator [Pedobacter heparinus]|uniref:helix-turn-helix transcriptional regulator n=1 Tax=Pedobacter heparinus TaxID=984 RepID=UPI0029302673|nr:helix-turn-helix transcriptional regulator [Pedobacter heparinus]